jgi:hypothetical protein
MILILIILGRKPLRWVAGRESARAWEGNVRAIALSPRAQDKRDLSVTLYRPSLEELRARGGHGRHGRGAAEGHARFRRRLS